MLQVLEACMKNCGGRFHNEVGKFRFLNELIKVVSPKVSPIVELFPGEKRTDNQFDKVDRFQIVLNTNTGCRENEA